MLVIHENRGLNPYIEDVARRLAVEGFLALAPDGLAPAGGYPGNDDDGRALQAQLDQAKLRTDMLNSARFLDGMRGRAASSARWGSAGAAAWSTSSRSRFGADLQAAVPFYGAAPPRDAVAQIRAPLLLHFADKDPRINAMWPEYEAALKAAGVRYEAYSYPGTQHGFHNNSTPRYRAEAAKLAWSRTVAFFKKYVS